MNPQLITMLKETVNMFAFLALELTLLFLVISYLVGMLQEFVTPQKVQSILSSRNGKGYLIAVLLGSITPFCSCSTIPFLKGLLRARAGFGPMMVFLFASPLLNPIIVGLFVVTFGVKVAVFYFVMAMGVSVIAGYILEKLGFERYVRKEAYGQENVEHSSCCDTKAAPALSLCGETTKLAPIVSLCSDVKSSPKMFLYADVKPTSALSSCCETKPAPLASSCCGTTSASATPGADIPTVPPKLDIVSRSLRVWRTTWKDFKHVLPYLFVGVLLGSFIYGFIPTEFIVNYAGEATWYAIPVAAVIGIPLYIRAEAVIPLTAALVQKGMAMGSVMAFIIGSAGASITEVILLKAIFKNQMIAAFLGVILGMAIASGFLYGLVF
ncbi:permease [Shewanella xiamenensis]|uniref:permease n=1 Tax=Shewanella xiamenensis TaxID=332186 RepID=UPI0024A6175F|nr:permease [Shewanella xiamenensis]MDI5834906.1 permease [Shewanella xiamenensis]MDI5838846.1 permease [Shewanella xiamenensis]MDI5845395.1 permease [Shewanella xiamenensis]MDI5849252.1 permease [Shewanella xiamenensis]MDI5850820.1 permease [Shewanella xiamenensis]